MDDFNVAIVIPIFSFSTQRVAGLRKCIDKLHLQTIHPNIYLIELILNEQISDVRFLASENVHYIEVVGNNYNRDLWQKECLLNIGASYLQKEDVVLFMDGDLFTDDIYWLEKVVDELESEKMILQPYLNVVDSINPLLNFSSVASSVNGACSPYPSHGSGSIWAFRYEHFKSFGGFNPYYLEGSGDTAFVMEFLDSTHSSYPQYLMNYPWFAELMRQQKNEYSIGHLDVDFIHINHGDHRYYSDRATYINLFNDFKDYYFLDNKGLLSWRDPCSPLRDALKVILNKINSNFINIDVDTVCTLKEKGIVSFHPYNPIVITSNCSIVSPQANWISVKRINSYLMHNLFILLIQIILLNCG